MIGSCAEKTYGGTTISDIVRRASISRTTFYKRFPDKRACFDAALDHCIELVATTASDSYSDDDPPPQVVRKAVAAVLELMATRPELTRLLATEAAAVDPAVSGRYRAMVIPALGGLWETEKRRAGMSPNLSFGRAQLLVLGRVAASRTEDLPELQTEIVYLALAPFAGHEEALRESRLGAEDARPEPVARS